MLDLVEIVPCEWDMVVAWTWNGIGMHGDLGHAVVYSSVHGGMAVTGDPAS